MRNLKLFLLFAAGMLGVVGSVYAAAGNLNVSVTTLSPNVTYSTSSGLQTYLAYKVEIASDPANTNTINNVLFTGTLYTTDPAEAMPSYVFVDGPSNLQCQFVPNPTAPIPPNLPYPSTAVTVNCPIGQLRAGQPFPPFMLFFKAPAKVTNGVADDTAQDVVNFLTITYYGEQTGGLPQSPPDNSSVVRTPDPVTLGTSFSTKVKSAVPKNTGATLFTGDQAVPSLLTYPFATSVNVPTGTSVTEATINLDALTGADANVCVSYANFNTCYLSTLTIPGDFSPYLTITLRVDSSNIKKPNGIANAKIFYEGTEVVKCNVLTPTPIPNSLGVPCEVKRTYYKNRSVTGWSPGLDGDWEFLLINTMNGGYKVF